MVDYSYCRSKLKENIEKIGEKDAEKIKGGNNVYSIDITTQLSDLIGVTDYLSVSEIENKILKPCLDSSDAWSCQFQYRVINSKKDKQIIFTLSLADKQNEVYYRKRNSSLATNDVASKDNADGVLDIGDLSDSLYNNLLEHIDEEDKKFISESDNKRCKVSAEDRVIFVLKWLFKNNLLTADSNVKCCSFYLSSKLSQHFKSTERFRRIFNISKNTYEGKNVTVLLDNIQGYLVTRPDIKCKVLYYVEKDYIKVDIVRDENKVDLHLIKASVSNKQKEEKIVELIKQQNGYREYDKLYFLQHTMGNTSGFYCNDNATVKVFNEMFRKKDFQDNYGVRFKSFTDIDKPRYFKKIRKGPDFNDVYFAFDGEYNSDWKVKTNFDKLSVNTVVVEDKIKKPKTRKTSKVNKHITRINNIISEMQLRGEIEKYWNTDIAEQLDELKYTYMKLQENQYNSLYNLEQEFIRMKNAYIENEGLMQNADFDIIRDEKRNTKRIIKLKLLNIKKEDMVTMSTENTEDVKTEETVMEVQKHKRGRKPKKVIEEITVKENNTETVNQEKEKIHTVSFVVNLQYTITNSVQIASGIFKTKKKTVISKCDFIKRYEEHLYYKEGAGTEDEMIRMKIQDMCKITTHDNLKVEITPQKLPNGEIYSILGHNDI